MQRRTLTPGEQKQYYCDGGRSNKYLLINYGFCFPNNRYDSYVFKLKLFGDDDWQKIQSLIDFSNDELYC